jgi:hypothetical protein
MTTNVLCEGYPACQEGSGMDRFIHRQNLQHYRKLLSQTTDEAQRVQLLKLLAEEEAKDLSAAQNDDGKSPQDIP